MGGGCGCEAVGVRLGVCEAVGVRGWECERMGVRLHQSQSW